MAKTALYPAMATHAQDPSHTPESLDTIIDGFMRPIADAASGFIFYSVEIFGTQVPLIVLWLNAGGKIFSD